MRTKRRVLSFAITVVLSLSLLTTLNAASPDLDFYKGKNVYYIVATKPGGGYDAYGRMVAKHMQKYLPGSTFVVKNVPGAGHIIGANEVYLEKPNGLTIGTFNTGLIYSQTVRLEGIMFDLANFTYIGKASSEDRIILVSAKSPIKSVKDLIESKEPIKMASSGVGTASYNETILLAYGLGANIKPIPGYSGRDGEMGMLRGEVTGTVGSYNGLNAFIRSGDGRPILQIAHKRHPELPNIPLATELNLSEKGRKLINVIIATTDLGRLTAGPPKMHAGRLKVLREAYQKALADPELHKDAQKMGVDLDPNTGEYVEKMMKGVMNQPQENLDLMRRLITVE